MERITSRQNERVKRQAKLLRSAGERRETGTFLCEGARLCRDAVQSGICITDFYVTESALAKYSDYCKEIEAAAERSFLISDHVAPLLSDTKNPQGVFCVCRLPEQTVTLSNLEKTGSYWALEQLQDPSTLGTVLRTGEALGISGVVLCGDCCDPFSPKVLRGSMGAVFRLPVYSCSDAPFAMEQLKAAGFCTYAAVVDALARLVTTVDFTKPSVMLIGNEGNGLTEAAVKACDCPITIPMAGRAESLNASAASSILLWEMMRTKGGI